MKTSIRSWLALVLLAWCGPLLAQNQLDDLQPPLKRPEAARTVDIAKPNKDRPAIITIGVHPLAPWAGADLPGMGILPRLATESLGKEGVQVRYRIMHWSKALEKVQDGEIDAALMWVSADMALDEFVGSDPLVIPRAALYYRVDKPYKQELSALKGLRLAVNKDYVYDKVTYQLLSKKAFTPVVVKDEVDGLNAVLEQRADIFLVPYESSRIAWKKIPAADLKQLGYKMQQQNFPAAHLLMKADRPDAFELLEHFDQQIRRMQQDGRYNRIVDFHS